MSAPRIVKQIEKMQEEYPEAYRYLYGDNGPVTPIMLRREILERTADKVLLIMKKMFNKSDVSNDGVSKIFYLLYPDDFIYDGENKIWYAFTQSGIYKLETDELLQAKKNWRDEGSIFQESIGHAMNRLKYWIESEYQDEMKKKKLTEFNRFSKRFYQNIENFNFIESTIKTLKSDYTIPKLREKLNPINGLIGFENGVFDLKKRCLRKGKHEDFVATTTGYDYEPADSKIKAKLKKVIADILPDKEVRKYILQTLAQRLIGGNKKEEYHIWIGEGRNGKSIMMNLMEHTLGGYFGNIGIDFFTETKYVNNTAASPELAQCQYSRIVTVNEPGEKVVLKTAMLKTLSGGDPVNARFLHKNHVKFTPIFVLFFLTNKKPLIDGSDKATKKRIIYVKFTSSFVENPDPSMPNEKKLDEKLKDKIKKFSYRNAFFEILLDNLVDSDDIVVPESIMKETKAFLDENDIIKQFVDKCCVITNDATDFIPAGEFRKRLLTFSEADLKQSEIAEKLERFGVKYYAKNGKNVYSGIKLFIEEIDNIADDEI